MGGAASHHENELVLDVLRLDEPAFAVNGAHQIVAWNDGAERLLGLRADDVIGMRCYEALAIGDTALCVACRASTRSTARSTARGTTAPPAHTPRQATITLRDPLAPNEPRRIALTTLAAHTRAGQLRYVHLLQDVEPSAASGAEPTQAEPTQSVAEGERRHSFPAPHAPQHPLDPASSEPSESITRQRRPEMLTHRELEVLRLLGAGYSTDDIARELSITRVTARNHVNKVLDKLGVNSRLQAVVIASQLQLI